MATWEVFEAEAPELAQAVRARFDAAKHHVLATLRADGSPRVSGTEVQIEGGELTMGSMPQAVKARDLQRDGRCAIHANPGDGSMHGGDAKVTGVAVEIAAPGSPHNGVPKGSHHFRLDLSEAVLTSVEDGDHLLIQSWHPGEPIKQVRRT